MIHPALVFIALLPLLFRLVPFLLPAHYLEPYAFWSADGLNVIAGESDVRSRWRNMGWWEDTDEFAVAGEALARKLLDFAECGAVGGGNVLDIAHGAGDSLLLHLSSSPPPAYLDALTSIPAESLLAQQLVHNQFPGTTRMTNVHFYVSSASYRTGKDEDHPLNPMRGFLGEKRSWTDDDEDDEEQGDGDREEGEQKREVEITPDDESRPPPPPYDLVYILDAIYHFPPSLPHFLSSVLPALRPGTGVVAYTDILPPADLNNLLKYLILPPLLSVPSRNLAQRPPTLEAYKEGLEKMGFVGVVIEDWTEGVLPGAAKFFKRKGIVFGLMGRLFERAHASGWKFVAVKAKRPASAELEH